MQQIVENIHQKAHKDAYSILNMHWTQLAVLTYYFHRLAGHLSLYHILYSLPCMRIGI